jgi:hypothetical protein
MGQISQQNKILTFLFLFLLFFKFNIWYYSLRRFSEIDCEVAMLNFTEFLGIVQTAQAP